MWHPSENFPFDFLKTDGSTQAKFGIVMDYDYTYTLCEILRLCLTSFTQSEYVLVCVCVCVDLESVL
jgi:hypothetical protein